MNKMNFLFISSRLVGPGLEIIKRPPVHECVRASVIPFVTFYKNLYFSASIKGIFTNFSHNVYIQENMPSTNFGLILKNKMAATAISLLKDVFFFTQLYQAQFSS